MKTLTLNILNLNLNNKVNNLIYNPLIIKLALHLDKRLSIKINYLDIEFK